MDTGYGGLVTNVPCVCHKQECESILQGPIFSAMQERFRHHNIFHSQYIRISHLNIPCASLVRFAVCNRPLGTIFASTTTTTFFLFLLICRFLHDFYRNRSASSISIDFLPPIFHSDFNLFAESVPTLLSPTTLDARPSIPMGVWLRNGNRVSDKLVHTPGRGAPH